MSSRVVWWTAKVLEGLGLLAVLLGVLTSIGLGLEDEGLSSMRVEMWGLVFGGGLFVVGRLLERLAGGR